MPNFSILVPWSTYSIDPLLSLLAEGHRVLEYEWDTKKLRTQVKIKLIYTCSVRHTL